MSEADLTALNRAGVVHDIGKVAVPDSILLKDGPLTEEEWAIMREHPIKGEQICMPLESFGPVLPIIRHHHEKMDGSGYPDGLTAGGIPLTARVLGLVDVYDALTTDRPYTKAMSSPKALGVMREEVEKGWWDGVVFEQLARLVAEESAIAGPALVSGWHPHRG